MGRTATPSLKNAGKEGDTIKKKVDKLQKECTATLSNTSIQNRADKLKKLYQDCVDIRSEMSDLTNRISQMTKADEPTKMSNFDGKKEGELQRLQRMMDQVKELEKKLEPDETEDEYLSDKKSKRKFKEKLDSKEDVDEDDDKGDGEEEQEQDDEIEEEADEEEESEYEYAYEDDGDEEEEEATEDEEEEEATEDEEEEVEEEEGMESNAPADMKVDYEVLHDFDKQEEGDLTVKTGEIVTLISIRDDGWWKCENADGVRGYLPSTFLKEYIKYKELMQDDAEEQEPTTPRTGKQLWGGIRKTMRETSATDVLHALGAVPAGFREPTSGKIYSTDDKYTHSNYSQVKLSNSNLFYKDLFYNPSTQKVRPRTARVQKIVTLLEAKNVPPPGDKAVIVSRLARLSLFDGVQFLSNITTCLAQATDREGKNWKFFIRPNTLESSECFVRIAEPSNKIGILIELSVIFKKEDSETLRELSCGWVFKPLFEDNGSLILNKQYELTINGGTPYESNVEVDPSIARRTSSKLMSLISRNKQPTLSFKTAAANNEQKERFDVLPSVLIGKMYYLQALAIYRYHLACVLIRDRDNLQSTEVIHDPFLNHFPNLLEQPDLTDVLLESWDSKLKLRNRTERRDFDILASTLTETFTEWIYPLMHIHMPPYKPGYPDSIQERTSKINQFLTLANDKKSPLAGMLSADIDHEPFDMSEMSYSVINQHCITAV